MVFQARTYAVLVVSAGEKFTAALTALLPVNDYWPVDVAGSVGEARRALLEKSYDLVIINAPLPDDLGAGLAMDICTGSSAGALLLVRGELYDEIYARVVECGVLTVAKPVSRPMLEQSLRTLCAMRERLRRLEERQASVEEKIAEIRLVNHAKWLLIQRRGMGEEEAQHHLERQAMEGHMTKRRSAELIIQTYESRGDPLTGE